MHTKIKWSKSISTNLLKWFLLLSLVPIILISFLTYKSSSDSLYQSASNELEHAAVSYISFINNWFYFRQTDIQSWSSSTNVIHFMHAINKDFETFHKGADNYIKSFQYIQLIDAYQNDLITLSHQYTYIYDLFLVDTEGNILYSVAKEDDLGRNLRNGKYSTSKFSKSFEDTLQDGKVHFSDLERYSPSGSNVYGFLTAPIISEEGENLGVFAVQIKYDRISAQFNTINSEDNGIFHYILGSEDLKLRTPIKDPTEVLSRRISTRQTDLYQAEHFHHEIDAHFEGIQSYRGPNGQMVIGEHHPIELIGVKWVLISEIDKDIALASSYALAYKTFFIALISIAIVFISAFYAARRITKPIQALAEASQAISSGQSRKPVSVDEENEIGQFAYAFNNMIKELTHNEHAIMQRSKEAQEALVELKEQKLALDAHSIVAITDIKGNITYVNDKFVQISGYSREELIGKNHRILQTDEQPREFWVNMYQTISSGKIWNAEIKNRAKDGNFYWVDTTIVPFLNADGKPESYIAIRTDITEQKKNQSKLIAAKESAELGSRSKAEFLASMSHEIRTPMNGIIGMLGLLKNSSLSQTQSHQVSIAESSAMSLLTIINDILDFSKVEAGKLELENLRFNLRDELGDFAEAIAFRAQEKGVELILDVREVEHMQIISDPGRLRQIMTNIVGNAIKFTAEGEILITCSLREKNESEGELYVSIKDSGIGIPQDKIHTLFDSFTQVDASTTRKYGGTGLGLSIVKKLVELMGGKISVESEEGKGSTFSFHVNVGLEKQVSLVLPRVPVKDKRVLIVDDNPVNREVLHTQLEHWGMEVTEAEDGLVALEKLKKELLYGNNPPFDIALLDMHMPHMDGAELGEKIKGTPAYEDMKLIMMTSLGSRGDAQQFAQIGFNGFFPKPTTTKDLFNALNVLIEDSEALKESNNFLTTDNLHTMREPDDSKLWPKETRILLVEDNMTNQIVANGILETFDLSADIANDGEEALQILKNAHKTKAYTLVLMDCQMPILDGYGASEAIRRGDAGEENIKIPIVAMTANAMKGDRENCLAAGMDDYLSKPINPDALKSMLQKYLFAKQESDDVKKEDISHSSTQTWNKKEALTRLAGNEDILKKVIRIYLDDSIGQFQDLDTAVQLNVKKDAELHAHSIKGASANIGAEKLQALASKMEERAKQKDIKAVASLLKDATEELYQLRALLESYLD